MKERLTPPDWNAYDHNMLINVGDMKYYYENLTDVVNQTATTNKSSIETLDGRVTKLEQSVPVGPGGDGAYLHLGGTPERYPTVSEMVEGDGKETSFLVVARNDGIYFYNPKTDLLIPPKKGGGTIAIHGQFPQIFDEGHSIKHDGRLGLSGVYTAKTSDIGLGAHFSTYESCKVLIVVNEQGEEYQTAFSPDGTASRIFTTGSQTSTWSLASGGGGGGIDPAVLQEIRDSLRDLGTRVTSLEATPKPNFTELLDTPNGYHPGKLVGYNLTGDALVPVDVLDSFKNMADTPPSYVGHGRKYLAVNPSEDGIDFIEGPNLSGLQTDVDDLHNSMITVRNENIVQDAAINDIDARVQTLENAPPVTSVSNFIELLDTPDVLQPKKYMVVNETGDALIHSTLTTDDTLGLAALGAGVVNGDALIHGNCMGAPVSMTGEKTITFDKLVGASYLLVAAWQDDTVVKLPSIVVYDSTSIPQDSVRAGRITYIYNRSGNSKPVKVEPGTGLSNSVIIKNKTHTTVSNFSLAAGQFVKMMPVVDEGQPVASRYVWVVLEIGTS